MKWQGRRSSGNVEDRRGMGGKMAVGGGIGTVVIVILSLLMGGNPLDYIDVGNPGAQTEAVSPEKDAQAQFVSVVLADTEDIWAKLFSEQLGRTYQNPKNGFIFRRGSIRLRFG